MSTDNFKKTYNNIHKMGGKKRSTNQQWHVKLHIFTGGKYPSLLKNNMMIWNWMHHVEYFTDKSIAVV